MNLSLVSHPTIRRLESSGKAARLISMFTTMLLSSLTSNTHVSNENFYLQMIKSDNLRIYLSSKEPNESTVFLEVGCKPLLLLRD